MDYQDTEPPEPWPDVAAELKDGSQAMRGTRWGDAMADALAEVERLRSLLQTARGALADIALSDDMTHAVARAKAARIYTATDDEQA